MKTKTILSIAILATLPLTAMAEPVGEYASDDNEVVIADDAPYYENLEISNSDRQHIASTAYVKGAYNDSIAAINKVNYDKQDKFDSSIGPVSNWVLTGGSSGSETGRDVISADNINEVYAIADDIERQVAQGASDGQNNSILVSMGGILSLIGTAGLALKSETNSAINSKRVKIYTTWDNDTNAATRLVEFETAQ